MPDKIHTVALTAEQTCLFRTDKKYRSAVRHQALKDARAVGCKSYRVEHAGHLLHAAPLRRVKPKPTPKPRVYERRVEANETEAAYREHGGDAPAVLGVSRQAIHDRPDLHAARNRGMAAYHASYERLAVKMDRDTAARLATLAEAAGVPRPAYLGGVIAGLTRLPEPIAGTGPIVWLRLRAEDSVRLRRIGDAAGRIRAALEAHLKEKA